MGDQNIRACQRVTIREELTRCHYGRLICAEKMTTSRREICAEMPSEIEALAELDQLIEGYCGNRSFATCSVETTGAALTEPADGWFSGLLRWFRHLGAKAANRELPQYPTGPARPRY